LFFSTGDSPTKNINWGLTIKQGMMKFSINFRLKIDFISRNNKRVAEVWLDEYKQYFYDRHPERYEKLDIGDISKQLAMKKKLVCRPFHYFFDVIAKDMLQYFPLIEPVHFASGTVCKVF
jgi:polypeptide N-acetylgalactosaminyltransferase